MAEASESTVLGNFANARFTKGSIATRFFRRDGKYLVNTDGPDGKLADFEIRYTFGVYPLQQYLIALPGGRLQALGIAWDSRPKAEGGQRWFHLYPDRRVNAGNPLHWTGIDQNWNYQCADCHSTNLRKNFDEPTRTFRTAWSEIDVGCEACHGPGSNHAAWAKMAADTRRADATMGLTVVLNERSGITWPIDPTSSNAARSRPRTSYLEVETCARCHARRGQFSDTWTPGRPLGDGFRVALIEPGLYYPDGQMRDEVYNHGSFLQSRMHAKGVTCADCHEPHSQKLRAPATRSAASVTRPAGTLPPRITTTARHGRRRVHRVSHADHDLHGSRSTARPLAAHSATGSDDCARHAQRMRLVPRKAGPEVGCGCHRAAVSERKPVFQTFAEAFAAGDRGAPGASGKLAAIVNDAAQPLFVRASAIPRLARNPGPATLPALTKALGDGDSLVRESRRGPCARQTRHCARGCFRNCYRIPCAASAWRRRSVSPVLPNVVRERTSIGRASSRHSKNTRRRCVSTPIVRSRKRRWEVCCPRAAARMRRLLRSVARSSWTRRSRRQRSTSPTCSAATGSSLRPKPYWQRR